MKKLTPLEAKGLADHGHYLLDIRSFELFDESHPSGSLSVEYSRKSYPERVAQVIAPPGPLVVVVDDDNKGGDAADQLVQQGYLVPGAVRFAEWSSERLPTSALPEIGVAELAQHAEAGKPILDIREAIEIEFLGAFPGAYVVPLTETLGRREEIEAVFAHDDEIAILCSAGLRSATAGSLLYRWGYTKLSHPPDGLNGWLRAGHALQRERA